jgi:hypothetical protein
MRKEYRKEYKDGIKGIKGGDVTNKDGRRNKRGK